MIQVMQISSAWFLKYQLPDISDSSKTSIKYLILLVQVRGISDDNTKLMSNL